ncbi:hypothetical protein BDZ91DRAFT_718727 [Kalaharituber pfeilii]|nr:hypothetical protein BDZ91DRAFT_718727 [Kalaharituber pfeilii]
MALFFTLLAVPYRVWLPLGLAGLAFSASYRRFCPSTFLVTQGSSTSPSPLPKSCTHGTSCNTHNPCLQVLDL